ncbi:MAG TPA: exosortase A [Sphingomonas sp.]|nr:exosortase A [Sphingomonas sp.]
MTVGAIDAAPPGDAAAHRWRAPLIALAGVIALLLLLFARDAGAMASIWWNSSTYEHCLVILPIIAWLVWQRAPALATIEPRSWALPLLWVVAGAAGWLLGQAGGVAVARHLGLVMMAQGAVAALLGRGATAALLFPLFYLFFLVPAGDALVPPLQTITAQMCMGLLGLVGVPAHIDGVFITTPAGWFKVAEACSGAKFLIAMIALGVLAAHLGFRSWRRRAAFLALCVVVPVIANGVRAFGTIWIAQYRGVKAASGIDHVIYGWIFFAIVIAAVLALSWRFFDRPADAPPVDMEKVRRQEMLQRRTLPLPAAALAVLAIAGAAPGWSALIALRGTNPIPAAAHLPDVPGWTRMARAPGAPWRPRFDGADRLLLGHYRDAEGDVVELAVALYAAQGEDRELVGFGHGAVDPASDWSWAADLPAPPDALAERIEAPGPTRRIVVSHYALGGIVTGSPARVKLVTLRRHLLGGDQRAAALLVSSQVGQGGRAAVDRFLAALGPVAPAIDRIAEGR